MPNAPSPRRRAADAPVTWRLGDGVPPSAPFVALVPGAEAPLIALTLPATLKGPAREDVARRQVLDRLGPGLDLRPAPLVGQSGGWTRAAVADRVAVLRWRAGMGAAAARCRAIMPDYLALPTAPGLWTVITEDGEARVRLGPGDGFTAEVALAQRMLEVALADARAAGMLPRAILRQGPPASFDALFAGLPVCATPEGLPQGLTASAFAQSETAVDFAHDPRADAEGIETRLRRALWPVLLLILGALGWAGAEGLNTRHDRERATAIDTETLAAARRDLLGEVPILDLQVQVQREIDRRRASTGTGGAEAPLDLLRRAAPILASQTVQSISLGADGVTADVLVADFRALDGLVASLAEGGVPARVARSAMDGGGVAASLVLGGQP